MEELIIAAFATLECEPGCSEEEVKSSYRQLVRVWHPDRFEADPKLKQKATEKMKSLNEAYQLLLRCFKEYQETDKFDQTGAEKPQSTQNDGDSNHAKPVRAEFEVGSESVKAERLGPSSNGEFVFCKTVEIIRGFNGRVFSKQTKIFKSRPVKNGDDFAGAIKCSLSFSSNPEQGVKKRIFLEGLQRSDYDNTEYSFPDGSSIGIINSTLDILFNTKLDWRNPRFGIEEIKQDYQFFEEQQNWKQCVLFAQKAINLHGQSAWGWIRRSYAMHCLSITESALTALEQAVKLFPSEALIFYNLACYSSQLGNQQRAKDSLKNAFKLASKAGSFDRFRNMALNDTDLIPIRGSIAQIALLSKIPKFF